MCTEKIDVKLEKEAEVNTTLDFQTTMSEERAISYYFSVVTSVDVRFAMRYLTRDQFENFISYVDVSILEECFKSVKTDLMTAWRYLRVLADIDLCKEFRQYTTPKQKESAIQLYYDKCPFDFDGLLERQYSCNDMVQAIIGATEVMNTLTKYIKERKAEENVK